MWNRSELFILVLVFIVFIRAVEIVLSKINEKKLKLAGAIDVAPLEYEVFKYFHFFWIIFLIGEFNNRGMPLPMNYFFPFCVLLVIAEGLRFASMRGLGQFWTLRLLSVPNPTKQKRGPYRYIAHPSYTAEIFEFILVPLLFQLSYTLFIFTFLNFFIIANRIRLENKIWNVTKSQ